MTDGADGRSKAAQVVQALGLAARQITLKTDKSNSEMDRGPASTTMSSRERAKHILTHQINAVHHGDSQWVNRALSFVQRTQHTLQHGTVKLRTAIAVSAIAAAGLMTAQHNVSTSLATSHASALTEKAEEIKRNELLVQMLVDSFAPSNDPQSSLISVSFEREPDGQLVAAFSRSELAPVEMRAPASSCRVRLVANASEEMLALAHMERAKLALEGKSLPMGISELALARSAEAYLMASHCATLMAYPSKFSEGLTEDHGSQRDAFEAVMLNLMIRESQLEAIDMGTRFGDPQTDRQSTRPRGG